ncbi:hypothetical protein KSC_005760 [Ktedonobacter sp. SOSP1-52]|nr:hypothetical protein KSC_005760 [Ktedonobacter sp. SOSP1-52]
MLNRERPRSRRGPSILHGKPLSPLSLEPKEVFKDLILFQNAFDVVYFPSCLAGKTQGKNVGTHRDEKALEDKTDNAQIDTQP